MCKGSQISLMNGEKWSYSGYYSSILSIFYCFPDFQRQPNPGATCSRMADNTWTL